ncbi:hypothetical protein Cgig2_029858 [Carnegiea gigantea]|uniref:Bifunctional inhibitor/plant lipid transfer protein/seed storage helical domain-containing protein n=1 Tax=Carnegiea gigantea TaxID=171969 RepID=A0A9Q1K4Q6_9CARY|nr:hypothetical protein Cgig2_029858 [Carnegiea gigantea]
MANKVVVLALMAVFVVAVLVAEPPMMVEAVTCDPLQLSVCTGAIMSNQQPSAACCAKLKEQKPCLCQYYNDPAFGQYVKSPGAKRVASTCQVSKNIWVRNSGRTLSRDPSPPTPSSGVYPSIREDKNEWGPENKLGKSGYRQWWPPYPMNVDML